MPFRANDPNHPAKVYSAKKRQSRVKYQVVPIYNGNPYSPRVRSTVLAKLRRGVGVQQAAFDAGIADYRTVSRWKAESESGKVTPSKRGRKPKIELNSPVDKYARSCATQRPFAPVTDIVKQVARTKGVVTSRSGMTRLLYQRPPKGRRYKLKKPLKSSTDKNLARIIDMQAGYMEGLKQAIDSNAITTDDLYYEDECPIRAGELPAKGRVLETETLYGREPYICPTFTLLSVIGPTKWIKCWLLKGSANDEVVEDFMTRRQAPPAHAPNLGGSPITRLIPQHKYLVWDRLGRAGRCLQPNKQHYNKIVKRSLETRGVIEVKLPPKGHEFNPIEVFQGVLQNRVRQIAVNNSSYSSISTFEQMQKAVSDALETFKQRPQSFRGWYKMRVLGDCAVRRWKSERIGRSVLERRRQDGGEVFKWPQKI